ncbi:hypothetical protein ACGF0D_38915 [Kitasatospora sp. NPDC048298]|uniref:hypothetical protein n=1 Tax=Kitasatospora sp. NPDC048298 TaxID=3364049 RepID=UPI0037124930
MSATGKTKPKPQARREPPYFTLKVGGLTVVLKHRPRLVPLVLTGSGAAVGTAVSFFLQARSGG